jgi:hypothetical protein
MKVLGSLLLAILFCSTTAMAAPASEKSIKSLLAVSQAQRLVDELWAQINSLMDNAIQQSLKGKAPSPKQRQAIDNMKSRMVNLIEGELAWEKLEPVYLRLFQESFTEEEIIDLLAFYKTPTGQVVIEKMPLLMQKTMLSTQEAIAGVAPQMKRVQEAFVAEMSAASK